MKKNRISTIAIDVNEMAEFSQLMMSEGSSNAERSLLWIESAYNQVEYLGWSGKIANGFFWQERCRAERKRLIEGTLWHLKHWKRKVEAWQALDILKQAEDMLKPLADTRARLFLAWARKELTKE